MNDSIEYMLHEYRARQLWDRREYRDAMAEAVDGAAKAQLCGDQEGYWRMSALTAQCQMELGLMREFVSGAKNLTNDPLIIADPTMKVRATTLYARALQCLGQVGESLAVAKEAAAIELSDSGDEQGYFDTYQALIASLAESGEFSEAWQVAQSMLRLVTAETPQETAGLAYWAIGNVAFLLERNSEGSMWHDRAALCLSPSNDVNLWAQFNKASAHVRIQANLLEVATLECIERAELAISVSGGSPIDELQIALVRSNWLLRTGEPEESLGRLAQILKGGNSLPHQIHAEAEQLLALALFELGRKGEALESAKNSESLFNELGATRMADVSRELIDKIESKIDNS